MLVQTELTKFAYVCSGVLRFESPNVTFDQYSERNYKKILFADWIPRDTYALVCAWSILIGQTADGSSAESDFGSDNERSTSSVCSVRFRVHWSWPDHWWAFLKTLRGPTIMFIKILVSGINPRTEEINPVSILKFQMPRNCSCFALWMSETVVLILTFI